MSASCCGIDTAMGSTLSQQSANCLCVFGEMVEHDSAMGHPSKRKAVLEENHLGIWRKRLSS